MKTRVYYVACSYATKNGIVEVDLDSMLTRLRIEAASYYWGEELNLEEFVWYNFKNKLKVSYIVLSKYIDNEVDKNRYFSYESCMDTVWHLDMLHDRVFLEMLEDDEYARKYFDGYGFDYSGQRRGFKR